MYVGVTVGQWQYLFLSSRKWFGLELMAIVFSLPWALLVWSCVIPCNPTFLLWNHRRPRQDVDVLYSGGMLLLGYS